MASKKAIDAKLEAFGNRMEEKMRSLFAEFSIGRPLSPRKSQHRATSDRRYDPQEHGHITSDLNNPCIKLEIRGEVKAWQPYTLMVAISFARIQEEQLNNEVRRTRVAPRLAMPRPTAPSTAIQADEELKTRFPKFMELSPKDKTDFKRVGLIGLQQG
ncbi:hypothetical protein B296_00013834 [Ensete ventricosum]|uniref:Uncharacterized protein n=1 Tax=Ensete ventricosum TaxID=4639 RepID=A0A426XDL5_ENSVE|nr:hypothetical protein B296_00013834 [Ensete ventricosum]